MLEESKRVSGGEVYPVRWIAGVVQAQLPGLFNRRAQARAELTWCLEHADRAPHPGWLREVYYQLANLARAEGDQARAAGYLRRSGYVAFDKPVTLTTPFSEQPSEGHLFSAPAIEEVVPGKVFTLSGVEFTEHHFLVSADGRELIAVDAGTRPDSARRAYQALRAHRPNLPPLTTVLVTHAHWDHVGGHRFYRALQPTPRFYASANYRDELARVVRAPELFGASFFGERFRLDDVSSFSADVTVDAPRDLTVGGTRIEIIPVPGGETSDALLFNVPDYGVMFVGDFIMPYLGAPFVEEGSLTGLLAAIDRVVAARPSRLLHGHEPLSRTFPSPASVTGLPPHLRWLQAQVLDAIQHGEGRAQLQQANLIPPGLLADPASQLPYLLMRENVINRLYDQNSGYWQPDLQGVDYLSRTDQAEALVDYLGVSERQVVRAAERLIADGKHEMAARLIEMTRDRLPRSPALGAVARLAYLKLMEKYQDFNPFKFVIYSHEAQQPTPAVARP
jgi:glyoxylase-like metal-dependent hydrolase (beta-lactamase superfamily II)